MKEFQNASQREWEWEEYYARQSLLQLPIYSQDIGKYCTSKEAGEYSADIE